MHFSYFMHFQGTKLDNVFLETENNKSEHFFGSGNMREFPRIPKMVWILSLSNFHSKGFCGSLWKPLFAGVGGLAGGLAGESASALPKEKMDSLGVPRRTTPFNFLKPKRCRFLAIC